MTPGIKIGGMKIAVALYVVPWLIKNVIQYYYCFKKPTLRLPEVVIKQRCSLKANN